MGQTTWTLADAPDLEGRTAVVTGATGGLGLETALGLVERRASVVLAGRSLAKGETALRQIRERVPGARIGFELLDLASLASVQAFVAGILARPEPLDILVNNAGIMALEPRQTTMDGFEAQFGTNYLGHFALTAGLLPALLRARSEARVVSLASLAHRQGRIDFADPHGERRYDGWRAYRQSKLAMLIFARELQRRSTEHGWPIRSVAAHPGWAYTAIIDNGPGRSQPSAKTWLMSLVFRLRGQSARAGALPILYAATAPEAEPGGYYGPAGRGEIRGPVGPSQVMPWAADPETAERLWHLSERETGTTFAANPTTFAAEETSPT